MWYAIAIILSAIWILWTLFKIACRLLNRTPYGKEIPFVGFIETDEKGRPLK